MNAGGVIMNKMNKIKNIDIYYRTVYKGIYEVLEYYDFEEIDRFGDEVLKNLFKQTKSLIIAIEGYVKNNGEGINE